MKTTKPKIKPFFTCILITLCLPLVGCSSYKTFDLANSDIKTNKVYKVTDNTGKKIKVKHCRRTKDSL